MQFYVQSYSNGDYSYTGIIYIFYNIGQGGALNKLLMSEFNISEIIL